MKRSDQLTKDFFDLLRNLIVRCRLVLDNYNSLWPPVGGLQLTSIFLRALAISLRSSKCSIFDWQNQKFAFILLLMRSLVGRTFPEKLEGKHSLVLSGFFKNYSIFLKFSRIGGLWGFIFLFYWSLGFRSVLVCRDSMGSGKAFLCIVLFYKVLKGLSTVDVLLRIDIECNPMCVFIINKNDCW